ncbi:MAG: CTP synthase [Oscillospiraceae bacterium]|jgi:CTP synthase|nr:CTP synthase [Oscillospiraceae bacterium]
MAAKYIFVTGGVVSGLGKGITAASLGRLLKSRGYKVTIQKLDPYLNFDPGTMNPIQHGEVFVTDDGAETDLDLGHYERFIDENLSKNSNTTSGKVYWNVIQREREGVFDGGTVQVIPHITNEIKSSIAFDKENVDFALVEIGGTVGDIESQPFLEAIRQFSADVGRKNCLYIHVTLVPYISCSHELKTKPTQHSVKELLSIGIQPDVIVLRSEYALDESSKNKIALFCNVKEECVIENLDLPLLYSVPLALKEEKLDTLVLNYFGMEERSIDISDWEDMVNKALNLKENVKIAIVGKYISLHDAYLSVVEALKHGGIANDVGIDFKWVDSETVTDENVGEIFGDVDGILVPGGFGTRGIEGKISAARYARENKVPYFGICLGMQVAMIEFARNVLGFSDANSTEIDNLTNHPVIDFLPEQRNVEQRGGTMRLGKYDCKLHPESRARAVYGEELISERHRHRYEVNNIYREEFAKNGVLLAGLSPDEHVVEMIELKEHPWSVSCQFHPEFKSRPNRAHPLFKGFIAAAKGKSALNKN